MKEIYFVLALAAAFCFFGNILARDWLWVFTMGVCFVLCVDGYYRHKG